MTQATVLLADDDNSLRTVLNKALAIDGYKVRATSNATTLWKWVSEGEGDIVVTDVVMPEMNGIELEKNIRKLKPELKCLFISGYTDATIVHHGVLDEGVCFLQKPFSLHDLGTKVKEALK